MGTSPTGRDDDGLGTVLRAEQDAPEQVRYHFISRELVLLWLRRSRTVAPSWTPSRSVCGWPEPVESPL